MLKQERLNQRLDNLKNTHRVISLNISSILSYWAEKEAYVRSDDSTLLKIKSDLETYLILFDGLASCVGAFRGSNGLGTKGDTILNKDEKEHIHDDIKCFTLTLGAASVVRKSFFNIRDILENSIEALNTRIEKVQK